MAEEKIGDRLKRLRLEAGLSQRELAKRSGMDREYICQIEANKTKTITLKTAESLASGLGISACMFFNENHREITDEIKARLIEHINNFK
jgi:repressor LexA